MKKALSVFPLMCVLCIISSSVFASDDIWKQIEDSYYNIPYMTTMAANEDTDAYMATKMYALEFGGKSDEYDRNMQELHNVSIESKLRDMEHYYAMIAGPDGFEVGIINPDGECNQSFGHDAGMYQIQLSDLLKTQLQNSGLNLQSTIAKHVIVDKHSSGILFSDGNKEFYAPITARFETIDLSYLYSKEELLSEVISHKEDMLIQTAIPDNYNEEGEFNPKTGAC